MLFEPNCIKPISLFLNNVITTNTPYGTIPAHTNSHIYQMTTLYIVYHIMDGGRIIKIHVGNAKLWGGGGGGAMFFFIVKILFSRQVVATSLFFYKNSIY